MSQELKLKKVEKVLIAMSNPQVVCGFVCPRHGFFLSESGKFHYCYSKATRIENYVDLRLKIRKELNYK